MTEFKALENWELINTPAKLQETILQAARILTDQGKSELANRFIEKAKQVPVSMEKESINYVLFAMWMEIGLI